MLSNKFYYCEICNSKVVIRSTIKTGDNKGLKVCQSCKIKHDGSKIQKTKLNKSNPKSIAKRKVERSDLPEFFEKAIVELNNNPKCANCGCTINSNYNPHWNIAHILPKHTYKSVMAEELNWIPLCSSKDRIDGKSCHNDFDANISSIADMPCFIIAKEKFNKFKSKVAERGKIFHIFDQN
jgi:hypothetical protein